MNLLSMHYKCYYMNLFQNIEFQLESEVKNFCNTIVLINWFLYYLASCNNPKSLTNENDLCKIT